MLFFKKNEEKKRIEKSYNTIMNNYKFKQIFIDKLEKDESIKKRIGRDIKVNRFFSIGEWITQTVLLGKFALYINSIRSPDISFHLSDYLIVISTASALFILIHFGFFIFKNLLSSIVNSRFDKTSNLFQFTNEELHELRFKLTSDEMEDLLIYLENTRTHDTLLNLDFCESPLEIKMNKDKNRTALIENLYRGKENEK